jgi:hypothetical protein
MIKGIAVHHTLSVRAIANDALYNDQTPRKEFGDILSSALFIAAYLKERLFYRPCNRKLQDNPIK